MILIEVSGKTYPMRKSLKDNGFEWDGERKIWWRMVGVSLNSVIEAIRPGISPLNLKLTHVDINGRPLSEKVLRIILKPEGDREVTDFYAEFQKGICEDVQVITNNAKSASPPDSEDKKKRAGQVDKGFF